MEPQHLYHVPHSLDGGYSVELVVPPSVAAPTRGATTAVSVPGVDTKPPLPASCSVQVHPLPHPERTGSSRSVLDHVGSVANKGARDPTHHSGLLCSKSCGRRPGGCPGTAASLCLSVMILLCIVATFVTFYTGDHSPARSVGRVDEQNEYGTRSLRWSSGAWEWNDGTHATSCSDYVAAWPTLGSDERAAAVFRIDPDTEKGLQQPFRVLCDGDGFMMYAKIHPMTTANATAFHGLPINWFQGGGGSALVGASPLLSTTPSVNAAPGFHVLGRDQVVASTLSQARFQVVRKDAPRNTTWVWYKQVQASGVTPDGGVDPGLWSWFTPSPQQPSRVCTDMEMTTACVSTTLKRSDNGEIEMRGMAVASATLTLVATADAPGRVGVCVGDCDDSTCCGHGLTVWVR